MDYHIMFTPNSITLEAFGKSKTYSIEDLRNTVDGQPLSTVLADSILDDFYTEDDSCDRMVEHIFQVLHEVTER